LVLGVTLSLLIVGTLIHQAARPPDPDAERSESAVNAAVTLLGVVYVGWLFSYMVFLHGIPGKILVPLPFVTLPETPRGSWMVLYMIAVSWGSDMGAYFVGRRWGRVPLAPRISPAKTREGAFGGLLGGVVMSLLWGTWVAVPLVHCLVLGAVLGVLAQVGDLCESAIKRDFGVKDFGALLPGHGGLLDRFDSVLLTAPVAYYYLIFFLPTP
jgi:phosphatidate cytidylyltransferase